MNGDSIDGTLVETLGAKQIYIYMYIYIYLNNTYMYAYMGKVVGILYLVG